MMRTHSMDEFIKKAVDRFESNARYTLNDGVESSTRLLHGEVCKRPELRPLLGETHFNICSSLPCMFRVTRPNILELESSVLEVPALAAFCIRYGLELLMLDRLFRDKDDSVIELVKSILAVHTASKYCQGMIDYEKEIVLNCMPDWLKELVVELVDARDANESNSLIANRIGKHINQLLIFSNIKLNSSITNNIMDAAYNLVTPLLEFAYPSECLLTMGGDNRLLVDAHTGLNQYGCSSRPRPWAITFSSCTSSSISDLAYQQAEEMRQSMLVNVKNAGLEQAFEDSMSSIRDRIKSILSLDQVPGVEVITIPSGTDAELYALYIVMGMSEKEVLNIVISSIEIGSGAMHAAEGKHFDNQPPLGEKVKIGEPLEGMDVDKVEVKTVEVRHESGKVTTESGMDKEVEQLVSDGVAKGKIVLLHLLDSSKTGVGGPSLETVIKLKEQYGESLFVVVDAAQMRLGRDLLQMYLKEGFMVMITGSKFFTGPPFSGALLIPEKYSSRINELPPFPSGLAAYTTKYDIPVVWHKKAINLANVVNAGLLLRWQAALWEMQAFYSVSEDDRYNTIKVFGEEIIKTIESSPDLELVSAPVRDRNGVDKDNSWDQLPSIFTFLILKQDSRSGKPVPLTYEEARFAYCCLNMDISRFLPVSGTDREHNLAAKRCHTGQPVRIKKYDGEWVGALRIAAGARLVSGVQIDPALGVTPEQRLYTEISTARALLDKLSVITRYWDVLRGYDIGSGVVKGAGFYLF